MFCHSSCLCANIHTLCRYEDVACDLSRQFTIERGRTECEPCTGKSTDDFILASEIKLFSDQCLVCAAGKYCDGDEGNAKPYPCPVGKYQDEPGVSCRDIFGKITLGYDTSAQDVALRISFDVARFMFNGSVFRC